MNNIFVLVAALIVISCGGGRESSQQSDNDGKLRGNISIDGSSTVYPISEAVAEEFKRTSPEVKVTIGLSGTGGGFKKFSRGETDINDASRPIKTSEANACKANNISYVELQIAYDGLAVTVSPENNWCKDLTVAELKLLWEPAAQGKIKRWSQIRNGWPDEEIHLFGPGVESGTYDYFTEVIVGKSHSSRGDFTASEDDNVLVQGVMSDKYALGFFGLAYYTENKDKLKLVAISEKGKPAVLPDETTVKNKTYSPLSRPLFLYASGKSLERPEMQEFLKFYLDNTRTLAGEVGYVSLSDDEISAEKKKLDEFIRQREAM